MTAFRDILREYNNPTNPIVYKLINLIDNKTLQYVTCSSLDTAIESELVSIDEDKDGNYFILGTKICVEPIYKLPITNTEIEVFNFLNINEEQEQEQEQERFDYPTIAEIKQAKRQALKN